MPGPDRRGADRPARVALDDGRAVDLLAFADDDPSWRDFTIPESSPPVRMLRLHVDPSTLASLALVSFPVGWRRPATGHYLAGEEFVVLRGVLQVGERCHRAGDWAWVPPRTSRGPSGSVDGALALAWFSGPAVWCAGDGDGPEPIGHPLGALGALRTPGPGVPGSSGYLTRPEAVEPGPDRDALDVDTARWRFLAAGRPWPTEWAGLGRPLLVRSWA
jgi:hypothetical protein